MVSSSATTLHVLLPGKPPSAHEVLTALQKQLGLNAAIDTASNGGWYIRSTTPGRTWIVRPERHNPLIGKEMDLGDLDEDARAWAITAEWCLAIDAVMPSHKPHEFFGLMCRIAWTLVPDTPGLVDLDGDTVRSANWLRDVSTPGIPFPLDAVYRIHAVTDRENIWLHTHGLRRCGIPELEILSGHEDHIRNLAALLQTVAHRCLVHELPSLGQSLPYGQGLEAALVPYEYVERDILPTLGGTSERNEEHPNDNLVLVGWRSTGPETGRWTSIAEDVASLSHGAIFYLTDYETERLEALARLRWQTFVLLRQNYKSANDWKFLAKFSYGGEEDGSSREHLWFQVDTADFTGANATLLNTPYQPAIGMTRGDKGYHSIDRLTDFRVSSPYGSATPETIERLLKRISGAPRPSQV